ncbi:hypothetical protein CspeluHIS016_0701660 [Cutaneotrichosporon spelunceum]|uniref:S-adenosyl-L-methionine-dependent methyltransferase n=1 Tax=Cutaneotrichosporon spelunceum TaxID=1672016 RepID=A0AAD3YDI5_9TREE|nr:hypothetical protein CspeluHIS016_0701660 [Cutaneotrichosporon spelunceum]
MPWSNPSSFLPVLPKDQGTLAPLVVSDLIEYMEVLKEMYMPPIHGGFTAADIGLEDGSSNGKKKKKRMLSGGSVDLPGLDLDMHMEGLGLREPIEEESDSHDDLDSHDDGDGHTHQDPFEREWAEKWLNGVVRRAQTWIESNDFGDDPTPEQATATHDVEAVLRDATAVLAFMAGTGAAGGLTRHLLFPLAPELVPGLRALQPLDTAGRSPETMRFLARLGTSPTSLGRSLPRSLARSPGASRQTAALPILLHDAPITDHVSVGVQTWGAAILLGREVSLRPTAFGLFPSHTPRVLELGAGTGLLAIICRKLLDLRAAAAATGAPTPGPMGTAPVKDGVPDAGLVVATDFHPDVLANLRVCVDLNATPRVGAPTTGVEIAKLDWCTFPRYMQARTLKAAGEAAPEVEEEELAPYLDKPFDLVIVSDCVYDPAHAGMIHDVASWVVRPPGRHDSGGVFHLISPIRPTFTPELESIDVAFPPLQSYPPLAERRAAAKAATDPLRTSVPESLRGEGLGLSQGLRLGVRGGKRAVQGRKGEGRTDEAGGYWWWEVGWG